MSNPESLSGKRVTSKFLPKEARVLVAPSSPERYTLKDPHPIKQYIQDIPIKTAETLADLLLDRYPRGSVARSHLEFIRNYHHMVSNLFESSILPPYWTLYPDKPNEQQMRITQIKVGIPQMELIPRAKKRVLPVLRKTTRDILSQPGYTVLSPAALVFYPFEIQKYMRITERDDMQLRGVMYSVVCAVEAPPRTKSQTVDLRLYARTSRVFDEVSSKLLGITDRMREVELELAHLTTAANMAAAISTPWGPGR